MKKINFSFDDILLFQFMEMNVAQDKNGSYIYSEKPVRKEIAYRQVLFDVKQSYEIFDIIGNIWGDWNDCPDYNKMRSIAEKWQNLYSAELTAISHDTLHFACRRKLSKPEAESLISEILEIAPNTLEYYAGKDKLEYNVIAKGEYTLWWD